MNRGSIVLQVVGDMNDEVVAPVSDDSWTRNGAVKGQGLALISIRRKGYIFNRKPVLCVLLTGNSFEWATD